MSNKSSGEELLWAGHQLFKKSPEEAASFYAQSMAAAKSERHLVCEWEAGFWLMWLLAFEQKEYVKAIDVGWKVVLSSGENKGVEWPRRIELQCRLVSVYNAYDPEAFEEKISAVLKHLESQTAVGEDDWFSVQSTFCSQFLWNEQGENAFDRAWFALLKAETQIEHFSQQLRFASLICRTSAFHPFGRDMTKDLAEFILQEAAKEYGYGLESGNVMYLALGHLFLDETQDAEQVYERAIQLSKSEKEIDDTFYFARRAFHAYKGEWSEVARIYRQQLDAKEEWGLPIVARLHRLRCEALQNCGELDAESLDLAREAARRLLPPRKELARIEKIAESF